MTNAARALSRARAAACQSEREWQDLVCEIATAYGWWWRHFHDSRRQVAPGVHVGDADAAGVPDLMLGHPDRTGLVWAELKHGRGRLSDSQQEMCDHLVRSGEEVWVWWPADIDEVLDVLGPAAAPAPSAPSETR